MDECRLTHEQIQALVSGRRIRVEYSALEEYGHVWRREIELIPIKVCCKRCEQSVKKINDVGFCDLCEILVKG